MNSKAGICQGTSTHHCNVCGNSYSCYACPDTLNPNYTENICFPCLEKVATWADGQEETENV